MSSSIVHAWAFERRCERVQVHDHELEWRDAGPEQLAAVVVEPAIGEEAPVDARVQGLDAAVEHLGAARHGGDIGHGQPGFAQRPCSAAGRDQLEATGDEPTPELGETRLVRHGQQRAARQRHAGIGALEIDRHVPAIGGDAQGAGQQQAHGPRQEPVLHRPDPLMKGCPVVAREDRYRLLGHDRAAVERGVDEVDRHARDRDGVRKGIPDCVRTREGRQE